MAVVDDNCPPSPLPTDAAAAAKEEEEEEEEGEEEGESGAAVGGASSAASAVVDPMAAAEARYRDSCSAKGSHSFVHRRASERGSKEEEVSEEVSATCKRKGSQC